MSRNVGTVDRWLRLALGAAMLIAGFGGLVEGTWGTVFKIVGFVPLLTAFAGSCPIYSLLGVSTCPIDAAKAPKEKASV